MLSHNAITRWLGWVVVALGAYFTLDYIQSAYASILYPYQIIWLEGAGMDVVIRILEGKPIYAEPTLDFLPFMYTPLYFYVTAAFTYLFGVDFIAGRMVSLCATLATLMILYNWVRKEGGGQKIALLAPMFFLAFSSNIMGWYHTMRVDNLFVALLFGGLFVYWHYRGPLAMCVAGVVFTLALLTKQQMLLVVLPVIIVGLWFRPTDTLIAFGIPLLSGIIFYIYANNTSQDWFGFYTLVIPASLPKSWFLSRVFWGRDIFSAAAVALMFGAYALIGFGQNVDRQKIGLYAAMLVGSILGAWLSRISWGGAVNVVIPVYVALCLLMSLAIHRILTERLIERSFCYLMIIAQLLCGSYGIYEKAIPTDWYRAQDEKFMAYIAQLPGDVLIPDVQFMQTKVGKNSHSFRNMGHDILGISLPDSLKTVQERYKNQLQEALKEQRFSAIILRDPNEMPEKNAFYHFKEKIQDDTDSHMINGSMLLPNYVFVPTQNANP